MARPRPFGGILQRALVLLAVAFQGCDARLERAAPEPTARAAALATTEASGIGAHAVHGRDTPIHRAFDCTACHACAGAPPISGTLAATAGAKPVWDQNARTCSGVYCHGATLASPGPVPVWTTTESDYSEPGPAACAFCHGYPPPAPHPQRITSCSGCHASTIRADGTIDVGGGRHIDGHVDVAGGAGFGCAGCHGFPPATGAHAAHFGLTGQETTGEYGDTTILQDRYPEVAPLLAPAAYAFGCGNCHPLDPMKHMDGTLEVELFDAAAPAESLKARASPSAAYDPATHTCSGTYCHSSGQAIPQYATTPSWATPTRLGCDGCHANPPRYESGPAGSSTANGHLALGSNGREWGHFLAEAGPRHGSYHGGALGDGRDAAPITCQTCHFDTTDPASTGSSGFYWLDTTGSYRLPGGDPARLTTTKYLQLDCTLCHGAGGPAPGLGKVLPVRHVNGRRDVVLDPRSSLPDIAWLPSSPNRPTLPYWVSGASPSQWRAGLRFDGTTVSFSLAGASYDALAKTCSNVACHGNRPVTWGAPYGCTQCHQIH